MTKGKEVLLKTPQQLGYFYAVVLPELVRETGFNGDELVKILYGKFSPREAHYFGSEEVVHVKTFSGMSRNEVSCFIDDVIRWAEGAGVPIPPPVKNMPHDVYIRYKEAVEGRWEE